MKMQYKLPLPRHKKAELLAAIHDRLYGWEFRQQARDAKRRKAAMKRKERALRNGEDRIDSDPQLLIPGLEEG